MLPKSVRFNGENSIVFKIVPSIAQYQKPSMAPKKLCVVKRQNVFFFLQAVMGGRKGLTINQLCFSSTVDIIYDNLDILLAVKPKKAGKPSFPSPCKS